MMEDTHLRKHAHIHYWLSMEYVAVWRELKSTDRTSGGSRVARRNEGSCLKLSSTAKLTAVTKRGAEVGLQMWTKRKKSQGDHVTARRHCTWLEFEATNNTCRWLNSVKSLFKPSSDKNVMDKMWTVLFLSSVMSSLSICKASNCL